jgi:hypothetical protein
VEATGDEYDCDDAENENNGEYEDTGDQGDEYGDDVSDSEELQDGSGDDDGDGPLPPPPAASAAVLPPLPSVYAKGRGSSALSNFKAFAANRENVPADRMPPPAFLPQRKPPAGGVEPVLEAPPRTSPFATPAQTAPIAVSASAAASSSFAFGASGIPAARLTASSPFGGSQPTAIIAASAAASSSPAPEPTMMAADSKPASSFPPPVSPPPVDVFNPLGGRSGRHDSGRGGRGGSQGRGGIFSAMDATSHHSSALQSRQMPEVAAPSASPTGLMSSALDDQPMVKLFDMFLQRLSYTDAAKREGDAYALLEKAFFHMQWSPATPAGCLTRMVERAARAKPPALRLKLERWAVVFFLGCNISILLQHLKNNGAVAEDDGTPSWQEILKTVLTRTNALADTFQELFNESRMEGGADSAERKFVPFTTIRAVLSRVRTAFEVGASVGVYDVASSQSQLMGAIVRRESAAVLFKPLSAPPASEYLHLLAQTQACIMCEFGALKSVTEIGRQLECAKAFHRYCPNDVELRASLYFRNAQLIVQTQALTLPNLNEARDLLAHGLAICPAGHPNRRVIARWFAAVSFATGVVPSSSPSSEASAPASPTGGVDVAWFENYDLLEEFGDAAVGLATANVALYESIVTRMLSHYTESGIASLMQYGRVHVRTAVVLSYFVATGRNTCMSIDALVQYIGPMPKPYHHVTESGQNFSRLWLMPLLLEKLINGVIVGDKLLVSKGKPFELHDVVGSS